MDNSVCTYILLYIFIIILYIIIYLYLYIIIIYIVMCPKNGTIFMFRVPKWDFCLAYVYIDNDIDLVESIPWWGIFYFYGGDFVASCFYILRVVDFV